MTISQVEAQERINTEKLMFELAGRIEAHEKIQNRLDEMKLVLEQKDIAMHEMADAVCVCGNLQLLVVVFLHVRIK